MNLEKRGKHLKNRFMQLQIYVFHYPDFFMQCSFTSRSLSLQRSGPMDLENSFLESRNCKYQAGRRQENQRRCTDASQNRPLEIKVTVSTRTYHVHCLAAVIVKALSIRLGLPRKQKLKTVNLLILLDAHMTYCS